MARGFLPQISLNGQATYQSDVTRIPVPVNVPGLDIPVLSKDQYKLYGELYQPISTSQWSIRKQRQLIRKTAEMKKQQLESDLYKLRDRISQLYFGVLLTETSLQQTDIFRRDIEAAIKKVESSIANGIAIDSDKKILEAELVKLKQRIEEQTANRSAFIAMLAMLTGQQITTSTTFEKPVYSGISINPEINRPELMLFDLQKQQIGINYTQINNRFWPNIGLYAKGGYGRPALNFLSNDFKPYYVAGVKMSWSISSLYTTGNEKQILNLSQSRVDHNREAFLLNTKLSLTQQANKIEKYEKLIASDKALISIREDLKKAAQARLTNGLISALDFIDYVSAEDEAKQNLILHRIQLTMALYKYNTISGN